jgi:hypothetical protein
MATVAAALDREPICRRNVKKSVPTYSETQRQGERDRERQREGERQTEREKQRQREKQEERSVPRVKEGRGKGPGLGVYVRNSEFVTYSLSLPWDGLSREGSERRRGGHQTDDSEDHRLSLSLLFLASDSCR